MARRWMVQLGTLVLIAGALAGCGAEPTPTQGPPISPPDQVALRVSGSVREEIGWPEADVRAMVPIEVRWTNKQGTTETYTGILIKNLLALAAPAADATAVVFVGDDGYTAEATLAEVTGCADCIVSFRSKGGFSIVMPGFADSLQVRGVIEVQVR